MKWRALDQGPHDVRVAATGEVFRTLASFAGHDGERDILKAHLVADGDTICLLTEYEDAAGMRALGRTTQWPIDILAASGDAFDAVQGAKILAESKEEGATSLEDLEKEFGDDVPPIIKGVEPGVVPAPTLNQGGNFMPGGPTAKLAEYQAMIAQINAERPVESEGQGGGGGSATPVQPDDSGDDISRDPEINKTIEDIADAHSAVAHKESVQE